MDYMAPPLKSNPTNNIQQRMFNPSQQLDNQSEQHALLGHHQQQHHQEQQTYQYSNDSFAMPPKTPRSVPLQQQQQLVRDTKNVYHQQQDNSCNQFQTNNGKKASPFSRPPSIPHSEISMSTSQQMIDSHSMSRSIENFDQQQPKP
jgi:hypothetical protein